MYVCDGCDDHRDRGNDNGVIDENNRNDLVEAFVGELSKRVSAIPCCVGQYDWEGAARLVHQIKGAGGPRVLSAI